MEIKNESILEPSFIAKDLNIWNNFLKKQDLSININNFFNTGFKSKYIDEEVDREFEIQICELEYNPLPEGCDLMTSIVYEKLKVPVLPAPKTVARYTNDNRNGRIQSEMTVDLSTQTGTSQDKSYDFSKTTGSEIGAE